MIQGVKNPRLPSPAQERVASFSMTDSRPYEADNKPTGRRWSANSSFLRRLHLIGLGLTFDRKDFPRPN